MTRARIPVHPTGSRLSSPAGRSLSPASNGAGELSLVQAHEGSPVAAHGEGAYGVITSRPSGAK
jgi:hypothetical protein